MNQVQSPPGMTTSKLTAKRSKGGCPLAERLRRNGIGEVNWPTIFETCKPRADVQSGATKDEQFVADLTQVLRGTAPEEYRKPEMFFRLTCPTRGLKELKAVCLRLSGKGGEVASIIRLGTQYGGGAAG